MLTRPSLQPACGNGICGLSADRVFECRIPGGAPPSLPVVRIASAPVLLALPLVGFVVGIGVELVSLPGALPRTLAFFLAAIALVLDAMVGNKQAAAMGTTDLVHDFSSPRNHKEDPYGDQPRKDLRLSKNGGDLPRVTKTGQVGEKGKKIHAKKLISACQPHPLFQHWRKKTNQRHFVWAKWEGKDRSTFVWCPSSQETLDSFLTGQNGIPSRWPRYMPGVKFREFQDLDRKERRFVGERHGKFRNQVLTALLFRKIEGVVMKGSWSIKAVLPTIAPDLDNWGSPGGAGWHRRAIRLSEGIDGPSAEAGRTELSQILLESSWP